MVFASESWVLNLLLFAFGVAILVKGSDWFVDAAAAIARSFGVSELIIGLTLVSIGTSLPELASSLCAAFSGESTFIIGNIVGSNIANVALILGGGLLLGGSIGVSRAVVRRDMPVLMFAGVLLTMWFYFACDVPGGKVYGVGRIGGIVLLAFAVGYTLLLCREAKADGGNAEEAAESMPRKKALLLLPVSIAMITAGAKFMVDTVVWSASHLGVDPLVISLTVVAIGTSLPELAVTVSGVLKKRDDIALGNIIGSGIFNIFLIIGCCAAVRPMQTPGQDSLIAMLIMNLVALVLWGFTLCGKKLRRWQGWVFLAIYAGFAAWSIISCR